MESDPLSASSSLPSTGSRAIARRPGSAGVPIALASAGVAPLWLLHGASVRLRVIPLPTGREFAIGLTMRVPTVPAAQPNEGAVPHR